MNDEYARQREIARTPIPGVAKSLERDSRRLERADAALFDVPSEITETDMANAKRFADLWRGRVHYTPEAGWLVWDGKRWSRDECELRVMRLAKQTAENIFYDIKNAPRNDRKCILEWAKKSQSAPRLQNMLLLGRSEGGIPATLDQFDSDPFAFNCDNGVLDLRTGILHPHDPARKLTRIAPTPYEPEASFELWDAFLWRVLNGNQELYEYVRRLSGYLLTGLTTEQCFYFFFGGGANGKSVFLETLARLMGDYHVALRSEALMTRSPGSIPNDIARLAGARLVTVSETQEGAKFNETLVKDLTGGDTVSARFMRAEYFDFRPQLKLLIRGNHRPVITGTDDGIWRRLHLVPFEVQIPEAERDPDLAEKLRAECPGILAWAIGGLNEWRQTRLNPPPIVRTATAGYREDMDVIGAFVEECCDVGSNSQVKVSSLYAKYKDWAGSEAVSSRRFGEAMTERRFRRQKGAGGTRLYRGIGLKVADGWQD